MQPKYLKNYIYFKINIYLNKIAELGAASYLLQKIMVNNRHVLQHFEKAHWWLNLGGSEESEHRFGEAHKFLVVQVVALPRDDVPQGVDGHHWQNREDV